MPPRLDDALGAFAAGLGVLTRWVLAGLRVSSTYGPSVIGAALVVAGLAMAWLPLALVAAGVALLVMDWRRST